MSVFLNKKIKHYLQITCISFLAHSSMICAQTENQAETSENTTTQEFPVFPESSDIDTQQSPSQNKIYTFLDKSEQVISSRFKTFVKRTDEFFANEKVFYETSGSYLRLTGEAIYQEGGQQGYYADLKLKMKLPVTEEKISLLVESNPGEEEQEINKALQETPQEAVQEQEYFAGVQTTIGEKKNWQFKPSVGLKIGSPLKYYTRFRITREVPLGEADFQFKQAFYWYNTSGWESDTSGEFNYRVSDNLLFRSTTGVNWVEETDTVITPPSDTDLVTTRQIFSLTHKISERRAISYQLGFYANDEPDYHNTHNTILAHYRQNLHDDYLFMDLIPQITYRDENDFRADYSFTVRLEMVFKG